MLELQVLRYRSGTIVTNSQIIYAVSVSWERKKEGNPSLEFVQIIVGTTLRNQVWLIRHPSRRTHPRLQWGDEPTARAFLPNYKALSLISSGERNQLRKHTGHRITRLKLNWHLNIIYLTRNRGKSLVRRFDRLRTRGVLLLRLTRAIIESVTKGTAFWSQGNAPF